MKQNEYFINPTGFADPNNKFVCYSHRTKKTTVHCADGSNTPSVHEYQNIKRFVADGYWNKIDYQTAYRLLKPLDATEILHYYVPTTKNPRNNIEIIACNKITKKTTVYYKNGKVTEHDDYVRCGKLKIVTKQDAMDIIKNINKKKFNDIIFDNPLKNADEVKQDDIIYYGPKPKGLPWPITAYVMYNKTANTISAVCKNGSVTIHDENSWISPSNIESLSKDWKVITKNEALARVNIQPPVKEKTEDEKEYEVSIIDAGKKYVNLYYVSASEPWATTAYLVCNLHNSNVFAVKYDGSVEWFRGLYPSKCASEKELGNWKQITKEEALARINKE